MNFPIMIFFDKGAALTKGMSEFKVVEDAHLVMDCESVVWKMFRKVSLIVDSQGQCFSLSEAEKMPIHQNRIREFFRRINSGKVELHLWLSPSPSINLPDFKERVIRNLDEGWAHWQNEFPDLERCQERIRRANTFGEIIEFLQNPP